MAYAASEQYDLHQCYRHQIERPSIIREVWAYRVSNDMMFQASHTVDTEQELMYNIVRMPLYGELLKLGVFTRIVTQDDHAMMQRTIKLVGYFTSAQLDQYEKNLMMKKLAGIKIDSANY